MEAALPADVEHRLVAAGYGPAPQVALLRGGANNRVFRVERGDAVALLKIYFRHPGDPRDRLSTEFAFAAFAWQQGVRALPQPLAAWSDISAALYEYVSGVPVAEVDEAAVDAALDFVDALNLHRDAGDARRLPNASEACFSIPEHLVCVGGRVSRLSGLQVQLPIDEAAASFVTGPLAGAWQDVQRKTAAALAMNPECALRVPPGDELLSPCDFGFHNALAGADGRLRFLDFEYAGWDDPGRLVADFFCQPAVPVPMRFLDRVIDRLTAPLSDPELHQRRIELLLPVYRIRWCCILLNEFLQVGEHRRRFAGDADVAGRKAAQLDKAAAALRLLHA